MEYKIDKITKAKIKQYIEDNYREEEINYSNSYGYQDNNSCFKTTPDWAREIIEEKTERWQDDITSIIIKKGYTDVDVYKRAGLAKQTFGKMKNEPSYNPSKDTAIQICIGLKLNDQEAQILLNKMGYALSNSSKRDLIVKYCLSKKIHNIRYINDILYEENFKLFPNN